LLRDHPLPAVVGIEPGLELREFTVAGYLAGLARGVEAASAEAHGRPKEPAAPPLTGASPSAPAAN
jgi:hypothetical protein